MIGPLSSEPKGQCTTQRASSRSVKQTAEHLGPPYCQLTTEGVLMATVLLFHHALGVTPGITAFAEQLTEAGHHVIVPDLYDGHTFTSIEEGVAHASSVGFGAIMDRGVSLASGLGDNLVVAGFSLGVMSAQKLAQTRAGVVGALLYYAALPAAEFGSAWPDGVALQIHMGESDPWAQEDLPAAVALAEEAGGELFIYPTAKHLVADSSSEDYEPVIAAQIMERSLAFLEPI